jgi:hypothetical protein
LQQSYILKKYKITDIVRIKSNIFQKGKSTNLSLGFDVVFTNIAYRYHNRKHPEIVNDFFNNPKLYRTKYSIIKTQGK